MGPLLRTIATRVSQIGSRAGVLPNDRGVAQMLARDALQQWEGVLEWVDEHFGRGAFQTLAHVCHLPVSDAVATRHNKQLVFFSTGGLRSSERTKPFLCAGV